MSHLTCSFTQLCWLQGHGAEEAGQRAAGGVSHCLFVVFSIEKLCSLSARLLLLWMTVLECLLPMLVAAQHDLLAPAACWLPCLGAFLTCTSSVPQICGQEAQEVLHFCVLQVACLVDSVLN